MEKCKYCKREMMKIKTILNVRRQNMFGPINQINTSIKLPLTISINANQHEKIQILENNLNELDLVSSFKILKINNHYIYFRIIYNGSPNKFLSEIQTKGIEINTQNQIWEVQ